MRHIVAAIPLLMLALSAPALRAAPIDDLPAPIITRQAVFSIPFTVPLADPSQQPAEVRLLASGDRGATWQATDRVDLRAQRLPYKGGFTFRAAADGEYWFAIRTLDRNGQMSGNKIGAPELRVVVDTRIPRFDLAASRGTAGEIIVRWQAVDPNLKRDSLKLEYQSTGNPRWQPIALDAPAVDLGLGTMSNSATWWPTDAAGMITIKAEVSDLAGNTSISQARVNLEQSPAAPVRPGGEARPPLTADTSHAAAAPGDAGARSSFDARPPNLEPAFPRGAQWSPDARTDLPIGRSAGETRRMPSNNGDDRPIVDTRGSRTDGASGASPRNSNGSDAPIEGPALGPSPDGRIRPSGQRLDPDRPRTSGAGQETIVPARPNIAGGVESPVYPPVGSNYMPPSNTPRAAPPPQALSPQNARASGFDFVLPPGEHLRMVNSNTFELVYDVDSVGRSGIAKVELWATRDGGRTWNSVGVDSDNRSPFVTIADREGVYGYRMTVQSGSGLGGRAPQPGDLPEFWIGVDLTRPAARLVSAEAGAGDRAGEILIRYEANDALLANRPITLLQSRQPGGPWTTIASGLDNTGQYSWRFDNSVPDRVYLRLEVRDEAGNIGTFEAADPIALDRVLPQGRLRGVRPVGDSARGGPAAAYLQR